MRFVELRPDAAGESFNLHPRITVLRGLAPAARVAIVGFLHSVAVGETFDWRGTAEVHGIRMSLDRALELVGETAEAALIVEAHRLLEIAADPAGESTETGRAYRSAVDARTAIDREIAALAEELGGASRVRSDMVARLASTTARLDRQAGHRLDQADGSLGRSARQAERPDPWTGMSGVPERISHLRVVVDELDEQLAALPSGDRSILAAAVATARAAIGEGQVPNPDAAALEQAWTSLNQRLVGLESRMEAAGGGTEAVAARLDAARAASRAAEEAAVPRSVLADEAGHLEALHDRVLTLERRTGRSVRRSAARKEFGEAKAVLTDALEEIGYPTWAAFRMGNGMASVSAERLATYENSRAELETAEIEWAELMARLERDTELQDVLTALDQAFVQALDLLGSDPYEDADDDDPELLSAALRRLQIDAKSVGVAGADAVSHLRTVLDEMNAAGHHELSTDGALVVLGESWLAVLAAADEAAVRILRDRERAATELAELVGLGEGSRVDRLDQERSVVHAAEEEVAELRAALLELSHIRLELYMLAATELAVAEQHDSKLEMLEGAKVLERLAEHRLDHSARGPRGVGAVASKVPRGLAGSVPLVVLMGDAPIDALDALLGLPDDVQTIVIGDTAELGEWVINQGPTVAECVESPAFA